MEMTPLIDVVFLLLIFFMVTTSFTQARQEGTEEEIPLNLPEATTGETPSETRRMTFFVRADGRVELRGDVELKGDTFAEKLAELKRTQPEAQITLKGDEEATHGRIIELFDEIRRAGFDRVNLVTRSPD